MLRNNGTDISAFKLVSGYIIFLISAPGIYIEGRTTNTRATHMSCGQQWLTFRVQTFK